ncbi:MAG: ABC transporter permease [Myxococcales bacterium]|nr:ABC transporter permease [Myxococcales bacterium]
MTAPFARMATRVYAVAANTFREAVRDKVLYSILFFAALLLLASLGMREVALGDRDKVVRGVGLGGISVIGGIIAIFLGVGLVYKEIERRTIYTLASKPVPRWQILLGKYIGLWLTLAAEVGILTAMYTLIIGYQQGTPGAGVYLAMCMLMLELTLVTAFATLFSTFASPLSASAYTLCVYVIGHFADDLYIFGKASDNPAFQSFTLALYRAVPNLGMFNVRAEAVHGIPIPGTEVAWAAAYAFGYTVAVLAVAMAVFERRDFK